MGSRRCHKGMEFGLFVLKMAEQSSNKKLLLNSKKSTKVYNDHQYNYKQNFSFFFNNAGTTVSVAFSSILEYLCDSQGLRPKSVHFPNLKV